LQLMQNISAREGIKKMKLASNICQMYQF